MLNRLAQNVAAALLAGLLCGEAALADPLHKSGSAGDYVHEGSGWIFPTNIGGLPRVGAPYTIDGNDGDVGAEYVLVENGLRRTAWVDVYDAGSAASGAKLSSATAGIEIQTEEGFAVGPHADLAGTKLAYIAPDGSQSVLYFFQTPQWVVTVRVSFQSRDAEATNMMDRFVRMLRWDTLGADPGNLHGGG